MKFLVFAVQAWLWKYSSTMMRFIAGAMTALMMLGCMSRYSPEALQRMAPGAEYAEVCVRPPTVRPDRPAFAHNVTLQRTISDEDWDEFEQFAKTADIIYRYDPHAPPKTASRLPWPYHTMSCSPLVAPKAPPLREGMKEIPILSTMRYLQNEIRLKAHAVIC